MGHIGAKHPGAILRSDWYSLERESMMYTSFDEMPNSLLDALADAYHVKNKLEIRLEQDRDYGMREVPQNFVTASGQVSIGGDDE